MAGSLADMGGRLEIPLTWVLAASNVAAFGLLQSLL